MVIINKSLNNGPEQHILILPLYTAGLSLCSLFVRFLSALCLTQYVLKPLTPVKLKSLHRLDADTILGFVPICCRVGSTNEGFYILLIF